MSAAEPDSGPQLIDVVPDELALARSQLDSGLPLLAEATVRRRIAWLEADRATVTGDEIDAARALMAEALWRQGRPLAARSVVESIRGASPQRRLPMTMIVEAEGLAAAGELDRAAGLMDRVIAAIGADEAWRLRRGVAGRLAWPLPRDLLPAEPPPARAPWRAGTTPAGEPGERAARDGDERAVAARARLAAARASYTAGDVERGDHDLSLALRLDPSLAATGVEAIEPTLGQRPAAERLLLYGDLLRAAGREPEAAAAYDRAAEARS
jgi:tetratricopeptide (TPR) repeat protein